MLFILAESLAAYDFSVNTPEHIVLAVQRLLNSHFDGDHVVVIPRDICTLIGESGVFSQREKAAALRIRQKYSEHGALKNLFGKYSVVNAVGGFPRIIDGIWNVPTQWIADRPLEKASLVCEDLHDAYLLEGAAKDFLFDKSLHSISVSLLKTNGGGGNTCRTLANLALDEQKIAICVVDSDKVSPAGNLGETAKRCADVSGEGLFEVKVTAGRSLENALPWRLVDNSQNRPAAPELRRLKNTESDAPSFLDFKRGVIGHDIKNMPADCSDYWTRVATNFVGPPRCCASAKQCTKDDRGECQYRIHAGFGRPMLGGISDWFAATDSRSRVHMYTPSENSVEWEELGLLIACYGVSSPRHRV